MKIYAISDLHLSGENITKHGQHIVLQPNQFLSDVVNVTTFLEENTKYSNSSGK